MVGFEALITAIEYIAETYPDIKDLPTRKIVLECRTEAIDLAGTFASKAEEAAALYYVLCRDERRLGDLRFLLPVIALRDQLEATGMRLRAHATQLEKLRDEIAGGMSYDEVRDWFERSVRPRGK